MSAGLECPKGTSFQSPGLRGTSYPGSARDHDPTSKRLWNGGVVPGRGGPILPQRLWRRSFLGPGTRGSGATPGFGTKSRMALTYGGPPGVSPAPRARPIPAQAEGLGKMASRIKEDQGSDPSSRHDPARGYREPLRMGRTFGPCQRLAAILGLAAQAGIGRAFGAEDAMRSALS
jgi:hypothetical protein